MSTPLANDPIFRAYVEALVRHHVLLSNGSSNEQLVDDIEGRMTELWPKLGENLHQVIKGISSDLNWLRRGYLAPPKGKRKEEVSTEDLQELSKLDLDAKEDVGAVLPFLEAVRNCAPALKHEIVALNRGYGYAKLGLREVSAQYQKAVIELWKENSDVCRAAFVMLVHDSPMVAFQTSTDVIQNPGEYPPVVVAYAIDFSVRFLGSEPALLSRVKLVEELQDAEARLDKEPTPHRDRVTFYSLAAELLLSFGFDDKGIQYLQAGLKLEPDHGELLGWLGGVVYGRDPARGVELFRKATLCRTQLSLPWLYMANQYLSNRDFELAKTYAAQAAFLTRVNLHLAFALEIMAIGMSETGKPDNIVLGLLRHAHSLAPTSERIAFNLRSFELFTERSTTHTSWEIDVLPDISTSRENWRVVDLFQVMA